MTRYLSGVDPDWQFYGAVLVVSLAFATCGGCSPSALQAHATIATVTGVTVSGAGDVLLDARRVDLDECEAVADEAAALACLDEREPLWSPALAAYEATRVALVGYVEAIELARAAGEGDDILAALVRALVRVASKYDGLAAALRAVGVDAPALPSAVAALLGGAS